MAEYICVMADDCSDVLYGSDEYSGTVERRERVVRCRDCLYLEQGPEGLFGCLKFLVASDYCADIPPSFCPYPDGFCAWGERRDV